jgi:hypothetical protein
VPRPSARSAEGFPLLSPDRIASIASAASAVALDDHLLVGECGSGDVRLFNPAAALIWRGLEERLSESSIARAIAQDFGIDYGTALADVSVTLDAWNAAGLATFDGEPARVIAPAITAPPKPGQAGHVRTYRMGGSAFRVRYTLAADAGPDAAGFLERVVALLAPLEDDGGCSGPEIPMAVDASYASAYGPFCRAIVQRVFGPFEWLFTMHAATIAFADRAIALCAPEGSGKSTLAAWLAARGWRYFNDDLAIVEPCGMRVLPLPVAVGVKEGSRALLASEHAELDEAPLHRYGRKSARYVSMPAEARATSPAPLAAIVFSRYEAGADTQMHRVAPAQAARQMMEAGIIFSPELRPAMVEWMGEFVQRIPCHQLSYSSLREAEAALRTVS